MTKMRHHPGELVGRWTLTRRLVDLHTGQTGDVTGILDLTPRGADIVWDERGTLRWDGIDSPVTRRYLLRRLDEAWWMLFDDERPFHPWQPGGWVEHVCSADVYRGLVTLDLPEQWHTIWRVRGPRKDQRITTTLGAPDTLDS